MRIAFIHHYAVPLSVPGIHRHYLLARELKSNGYETAMISCDRHHRKSTGFEVKKGLVALDTSNDVPFLWVRGLSYKRRYLIRLLSMIWFSLLCPFYIRRPFSGKEPDLIIGFTPDPFCAFAACLYAKRREIPFALHVGDLWPMVLTELGNRSRFHPLILLFSWIESYLYRNADLIISPQEKAYLHFQNKGVQQDKVIYIPNGVALQTISVPASSGISGKATRLSEKAPRKFICMYTGSFGTTNGIDKIIGAAKLLQGYPDIEFRLIGGDFTQKAPYRKKCDRLALTNVRFFDAMPKPDIYEFMKSASCFIAYVPFKKPYDFGLGLNKLYEYMAIGRPVILLTRTRHNPIEENSCGIVVHEDSPDKFAKAILDLYHTPAHLKEGMVNNGQTAIREVYNFTIQGRRLSRKIEEAFIRAGK